MISEGKRAKRGAEFCMPASVDPRPSHHHVEMFWIVLLGGFVDMPRPPRIFLVPKSSDVEVRNGGLLFQQREEVNFFPVRVIVGMRNIIIPAFYLPVQISLVDV